MANTATIVQIPLPPVGFAVTRQQQTQFVNDYCMLGAPNATPFDRKLLRLVGLMYELNNVRGVDYRTNLRQLQADADAYFGGISQFDLETALAVIEWSNGNRADASIPNNLPALRQQYPSIGNGRPIQEIDRMIALLRIRLGQ